MNLRRSIVLLVVLLAGCHRGYHVDLIVPPVSDRIAVIELHQTYTLPRAMSLTAMGTGDRQPEIHFVYDKPLPPGTADGQAFVRVPFDIDATETHTEAQQDPADPTKETQVTVTNPVPARWDDRRLPVGTQIRMSIVEIYSNSHVYKGRVLNGDATNCHVLLVLPASDSALPTLTTVQHGDQNYLSPVDPTSKPASGP